MNWNHRLALLVLCLLWAGIASAADRITSTTRPTVELTLEPAHEILKTDEARTLYLKVGLKGHGATDKKRAPVNVALVLDRSGSMQGEKIRHAKEAAIMFIDRLADEDIVSVVTYDSTVHVLVPATRCTDKEYLRQLIGGIEAGGNTALYGGVAKGAAEIRKFHSKESANRIILLSDGLANVGPSSSEELATLGVSLAKEGISISTIGLGLDYNEDLMNKLAMAGDGNPAFAEKPSDLANFFDRELRSVTEIVATDLAIKLRVADGIRPVRVLGDRGDVHGQTVTFRLNQVYHDWENYFIVELDVPATHEARKEIVHGTAQYHDLIGRREAQTEARAVVRISASVEEVEKSRNDRVVAAAILLVAAERTVEAVKLRDEGNIEQARQVLVKNADWVATNAAQLPAEFQIQLQSVGERSAVDAQNLDAENYQRQRKVMQTESQGSLWNVKQ